MTKHIDASTTNLTHDIVDMNAFVLGFCFIRKFVWALNVLYMLLIVDTYTATTDTRHIFREQR